MSARPHPHPPSRGALAAAADHYAARVEGAREAVAAGERVVGVVGADVPLELVAAAGAVPLRLHSRRGEPSEEAVRLLGGAIDPVAHSILTQMLDGELGFLTGVLFSRDCQASLQLFYVLRQLAAREPRAGRAALPPVHLVDVLHLPRESTARYNEAQLRRCAEVLATWTRTTPGGPALRRAVAAYRRLRGLLMAAQELREKGAISGRQFLHLAAAASSMSPARAAGLVAAAVAEAGRGEEDLPRTAPAPGHRLFFSGSGQDDDDVYAAIEGLGVRIVGEDHDWGQLMLTLDVDPGTDSEAAGADGPATLLAALARAYQRRGPASATAPLRERAAFSAAQARAAGAEAVLCLVRAFDDAPTWDYPVQKQLLDADGIPSALLARQPLRPDGEELRRAVVRAIDPAARPHSESAP